MATVVRLDKFVPKRSRAVHENPVVIWPLNELSPASSKAWLNQTIDGKPYANVALSLWTHHPKLRAATERLGSYLTPKWPTESGESLFSQAIERASTKVNAAVSRGETYEARIVAIYLYWLLESVSGVARLAVYGENKTGERLQWRYFSEPLHTWAKSHGMKHLEAFRVLEEPSTEEIVGLRIHLIAKITDDPVDAGYVELLAPRG